MELFRRNFYPLLVFHIMVPLPESWNPVATVVYILSRLAMHDFWLPLSLSFEYDVKHWGNHQLLDYNDLVYFSWVLSKEHRMELA